MNYSVYEFIFPNNKRYIGMTSRPINERWSGGYGYRGQVVGKAIQKYGWDNVEKNIVASNVSKETACNLERELIQKFHTLEDAFGYNKSEGGDCGCCLSGELHWTYNTPRPKSTRQKISNSLKGRYISKSNPHHTSVKQYTLNDELIKEWDSFADIERELGFRHAHIVDCCKGRRNTAYGFHWKYQKL